MDEVTKLVKNDIRDAKYVSFTSDSWSSKNNKHSLLSLTVHFWKNHKREYRVLGVKPIVGRHTGENLSDLIKEVIAEYNIPREKIHLLVRDSASSMIKTARLAELDSIDCFAHKLQLVFFLPLFLRFYKCFRESLLGLKFWMMMNSNF